MLTSPKVIRDVVNVHMEELRNQWQEEQEGAEDDAEKYVIVFIGKNTLFLNCYYNCLTEF